MSYRCSVASNEEPVQLAWFITFPGMMTTRVTVDGISRTNLTRLEDYSINATVTRTAKGLVESVLTLKASENIRINGTLAKCGTAKTRNVSVLIDPTTLGLSYFS